ncbi:MAG: response regulator transcription factor [Bacteroidia bacterium]|nr:response regulator transcription factor [Bacteroidia bacterium]
MSKIKLIIVDDSAADLYVLLHTFKNHNLFTVIQTFSNGSEFLRNLNSLPPFDCLLIDMHLPLMGGKEVAEQLKGMAVNFKTYIITYGIYPSMTNALIEAGVHAFTRKEAPLLELLISEVVAGNTIYEDQTKQTWIVNGTELCMFELEQRTWLTILNLSERAILNGFANNLSIHIISRDSEIDIETLYKYQKRIMKKLKLNYDEELIAWALKQGFGYYGINGEMKKESLDNHQNL